MDSTETYDFPDLPDGPDKDNWYATDDDAEFERLIADYDGDKDYVRVTRKRILDANRAYDLIDQAEQATLEVMTLLAKANTGTTRTRHLSLAITNIETGLLFMRNVAYAVAPHDMNSTDPITDNN